VKNKHINFSVESQFYQLMPEAHLQNRVTDSAAEYLNVKHFS